jgi:prepilin-type N-terminal cleavage/methylation domain-containing protein/prepilin-type processing-associated H-X9-DG protein
MPHSRVRDASGFTLIELLVVIAVLAILASILLPVFLTAKRSSYAAVCASNLRQFGMSFQMYAGDYDDCLPTPGGDDPKGVELKNCWIASAWRGINSDMSRSALWPYIQVSIKPNEKNNLWSCPLAGDIDPVKAELAWSPGCNYSMNDYVRNAHPGERLWDKRGWSYCVGMNLAQCKEPDSTILLFEAVQMYGGDVGRLGSPYFQISGMVHSQFASKFRYPNVPQNYHQGRCNFLFVDGHVKAMDPNQTITQACRDGVKDDISNFTGYEADVKWKSAYPGYGPEDHWNPHVPGVIYP